MRGTLSTAGTRLLVRMAGELGELAPSVEAQRLHYLEGVCGMVDAQVAILCDVADFGPGGAGRPVRGVDRGWNTESERARVLAFMANDGMTPDPLGAAMMRAYQGRVLTRRRRDAVTDADWYGSTYFNDYRRVGHMDDALYCTGPAPGGDLVLGIGLSRPAGARPFTEAERDLVHLAHLECASRIGRRPPLPGADTKLSRREREILEHLLAGRSEKQVATALGLSRNTVHQYVTALYRAFGVSSRAELLSACLGGRRFGSKWSP